MSLPFTREQFVEVFRWYNEAIGIAPIILTLAGMAAFALTYSRFEWRHRASAGVLAVLWLWAGVVYHWGAFTAINPAAWLFGAMFAAQGLLLLTLGVLRGRMVTAPTRSTATVLGWAMSAYALIIYPVVGWMLGHGYPSGPSFGAPCPVVIFTLGMTFIIAGRIPVLLVAIPLIWAIIGTSAALQLGMLEDLGLSVAALLVAIEVTRRRLSARAVRSSVARVPART